MSAARVALRDPCVRQSNLPLDGSYNPGGDGGANAHIFVIDTGINMAHLEFAGRIGDGYDFVDNDLIPEDVRAQTACQLRRQRLRNAVH
jgi:hypothetical protein